MWHSPSTLQSLDSDNISWTLTGDLKNVDFQQIKTAEPLRSVASSLTGSTSRQTTDPKQLALLRNGIQFSRTAPLVLTGFGFDVSGTIQGIELEITAQRYNRVVDWSIRLYSGNTAVGSDRAVETDRTDGQPDIPNNITVYGSPTDTWGVDLTAAQVNAPDFGIWIEMSSHPITPHADTVYIDRVRARVYTS